MRSGRHYMYAQFTLESGNVFFGVIRPGRPGWDVEGGGNVEDEDGCFYSPADWESGGNRQHRLGRNAGRVRAGRPPRHAAT